VISATLIRAIGLAIPVAAFLGWSATTEIEYRKIASGCPIVAKILP